MTLRYSQCDDTCTVDCGHCKGNGSPFARGGAIPGHSGTSDTIPAVLHRREHVYALRCRWLSRWDDAVMPCHERQVPGSPFCAEHLIEHERTKS